VDINMDQLSFIKNVELKGFDITSEMYSIYMNIMSTFWNYEATYKYISGSAKEDIESAIEPGEHLIIEPIIIPSVSSAIFIGMYSDFEAYLNMICNAHSNNNGSAIVLKDISGSGIERAVTYLTKVVGLTNLKSTAEWNDLKHWNRVRNILVHNNRVIRNDVDEKSIKFLNLKINSKQNRVYLLVDDCEKFHDLIVRFFKLCV
jgi:hypothetical protein